MLDKIMLNFKLDTWVGGEARLNQVCCAEASVDLLNRCSLISFFRISELTGVSFTF